MDRTWALLKLTDYTSRLDAALAQSGGYRQIDDVLALQTTAAEIMAETLGIRLPTATDRVRMRANRALAVSAIGKLQHADEVAEKMGPQTPQLDLGGLHPWVWGAAEQFWASGLYRDGVAAAAKVINGRVQQLTGLRVSDNDLMNQALGVGDPKPGMTKLRVPGDHSDGIVRGQQQALRDYAAGCFGVIRNPAVHDEDDWPEQLALERLAALSVLARAIEGTTAVTEPAAAGA